MRVRARLCRLHLRASRSSPNRPFCRPNASSCITLLVVPRGLEVPSSNPATIARVASLSQVRTGTHGTRRRQNRASVRHRGTGGAVVDSDPSRALLEKERRRRLPGVVSQAEGRGFEPHRPLQSSCGIAAPTCPLLRRPRAVPGPNVWCTRRRAWPARCPRPHARGLAAGDVVGNVGRRARDHRGARDSTK